MKRAVVIRTAGDREIAGAIVDGMTRKVIPLTEDELGHVRAECIQLRDRRTLRRRRAQRRQERDRELLALKYPIESNGRLYGALLGAWAALWLCVTAIREGTCQR